MTIPPLGSPSIPRHDSADETSSSSNSVVVETAAQVETLTILPAVQPERSGSDLTGVAAEIGGMPPPKARLKVPLEKGYSQMVWLRLLQTEPDLAGLKGKSNRRLISLEEVKQHRTDDDAWTILRGRVYNISPYIRFHPGGRDMLMKGAGRDCTSLFNKYHAWVNAEYLLEKCLVGILDVTPT